MPASDEEKTSLPSDDKNEAADEETFEHDEGPPSPSGSPPASPDGGLYAWLSVVGTAFVLFNAWGLVQAFGAYQAYYTTALLRDYDASAISWIGTIQAWLLVFVGVVTGPIFDQGYLRTLLVVGSSLMVFGVMMLSLATKYYEILLAQAICVGLGSGMIFTPALAQVTVSFAKHRQIALSLTTAGVGLGGITYPIVFDQLEPRIGFAWATRVIGFICLGTLTIATFILGWKKAPTKPPRSLFDLSALKEMSFIVFNIAVFLMFTAYWVPWFYITLYGRFGVGASASFSFYLLSITNAASIVGRLTTPIFQRWLSPLHMLFIASVLGGTLVWSWISIHEFGSFVTFCVFWGLFSGPMAVLPASAIVMLSPSLNVVGARMGMVWATSSIGVLIGSPIAGAVSNPREGQFLGGQIYAGACLFGSTAMYAFALWLLHSKQRRRSGD